MDVLSTNTTTTLIDEEDGGEDGLKLSLSQIILAVGIFFLMIGVGASCERELFLKMFRNRKAFKAAMIGVGCQFIIMPVLTYTLAVIFGIRRENPYATLGFVLVGCMPGGGSSNILTVWTGGVLELSVFMTLISTVLSFGLTPFWIWFYSTQAIGLEAQEMAFDQIGISFAFLLIPLSIGWGLNWKVIDRKHKNKVVACSSVLAVIIFVATIVLVGLEYSQVFSSNWQYYTPAACLYPMAAILSYAISNLVFKLEPALCRTIVMEVGIQNLSLGLQIGYVMTNDQALRDLAMPFPLLYSIFMYIWSALFIPIFQYQKYYNQKNNITDIDSNFFGTTTEEKKEVPLNECSESRNKDENKSNGNISTTNISDIQQDSDV